MRQEWTSVSLITHTYSLDQVVGAYKLFGERVDGVIKVAVRPGRYDARNRW